YTDPSARDIPQPEAILRNPERRPIRVRVIKAVRVPDVQPVQRSLQRFFPMRISRPAHNCPNRPIGIDVRRLARKGTWIAFQPPGYAKPRFYITGRPSGVGLLE